MITEEEFKIAVREYTKNLYRYLNKTLRDEGAAKDLAQDCYVKLWTHRNNVDPLKIKAWLFAVAHNAMMNYLKKESRTTRIDNHVSNSIPAVFQHDLEIKEIIEKSLATLEPLQKSIIL